MTIAKTTTNHRETTMNRDKAVRAYNAALALLTSSTSGWTWDKALAQVVIAFQLNEDETDRVRKYELENDNFRAELRR